MKSTFLKALLLFLSIPVINSIAFGLGALVHEMHQATITAEQFADYQVYMLVMIVCSALSIFAIEFRFDRGKISDRNANLLYLAAFTVIGLSTMEQFAFRPYEHTLTFLCIVSVLVTRRVFDWKGLRTNQVRPATAAS